MRASSGEAYYSCESFNIVISFLNYLISRIHLARARVVVARSVHVCASKYFSAFEITSSFLSSSAVKKFSNGCRDAGPEVSGDKNGI